MMRNLVNSILTAEEECLGFQRVWIENERNRFGDDPFGEPHIIEAVAYKVGESVWIFKMNKPSSMGGGVFYNEMQYGVSGFGEHSHPDWQNVRLSNWDDPSRAIQAASLARDVERQPAIPPEIIGAGNERRILFEAAHVTPHEMRRHEGQRAERNGRAVISFPVR